MDGCQFSEGIWTDDSTRYHRQSPRRQAHMQSSDYLAQKQDRINKKNEILKSSLNWELFRIKFTIFFIYLPEYFR